MERVRRSISAASVDVPVQTVVRARTTDHGKAASTHTGLVLGTLLEQVVAGPVRATAAHVFPATTERPCLANVQLTGSRIAIFVAKIGLGAGGYESAPGRTVIDAVANVSIFIAGSLTDAHPLTAGSLEAGLALLGTVLGATR